MAHKVPMSLPSGYSQTGNFHAHPATSSWFHPWSIPPTHNSPYFNPRSYDTVAPWAYEHVPAYSPMMSPMQHPHFSELSPLEREMWNAKHNMENLFHHGHRHSFSSELNLQPSRPGSLLEHYSLLNPIRVDAEGNRWLNCYFDLRSYKPEEINVTLNVKERYISVEAAHEVKDSKEHYIKRSYSRKVFLPSDLKVDLAKLELKSCLTHEGLLCIEAALPKLSLEEAREVNKFSVVHPTNVYNIPVKTA